MTVIRTVYGSPADASGAAAAEAARAEAAEAAEQARALAAEATAASQAAAAAAAAAAEATRAAAAEAGLIPASQKGAANGVGTLDSGGRQPIGQSPTSVVSGDSSYAQGAKEYVGPTTPAPPGGTGEYVWIKTDGSGNLVDIVTGKV